MYYLKEKKIFYKFVMLLKYVGKFGKFEKVIEIIVYYVYFLFVYVELWVEFYLCFYKYWENVFFFM